jgi:hypothetical protein
MTFTVGQHVKTRDGRDARVICVDRKWDVAPIIALVPEDDGREGTYAYNTEGRHLCDQASGADLIPPKRSGTVWINVYDGGFAGFGARDLADNAVMEDGRQASEVRLACKEVQWTEGDGL